MEPRTGTKGAVSAAKNPRGQFENMVKNEAKIRNRSGNSGKWDGLRKFRI